MRKSYPYLEDSYIYQTDIERQKRLLLNDINKLVNQRQYIKITLLDWDENPLKEIEGEISSGSISKVADSPVRRTAQLSCAVDARSYSVENGKADFAINKKVFIEVGVKNETPHYKEYPIFWFPEGVFFIASFSINSGSNASTVISISLKDKMAMLNGDVGGKLPATVIFDTMDTQLPSGEYIEKKVLIYNIIQELVHHYGGEDLNRIVIQGVPLRIRRVMQWNGEGQVYSWFNNGDYDIAESNEDGTYMYSLSQPESGDYNTYSRGDDIGYVMDDFVIPDELTGAPGESVTSVLDKIKGILGNYEYFYDVFGVFHFREIRNYYVTTQARTLLDEIAENDYLVETNNERSTFTFDDTNLLTSITVNPQYENIKNDYIVMGHTETEEGISYDVRYHLAIDKKPRPLGTDDRNQIEVLVNNDAAIEEKQQELSNLKSQLNNKDRNLQDALFKINRALNYIAQKDSHYWGQDKLLFKFLSDRYPLEDKASFSPIDMINIYGESMVEENGYGTSFLSYFFNFNDQGEDGQQAPQLIKISTNEHKNTIIQLVNNNIYVPQIQNWENYKNNLDDMIDNLETQQSLLESFIDNVNNTKVYTKLIVINPAARGWYEENGDLTTDKVLPDEGKTYYLNNEEPKIPVTLYTRKSEAEDAGYNEGTNLLSNNITYYELNNSPTLREKKVEYARLNNLSFTDVDEKYEMYETSLKGIKKAIYDYENDIIVVNDTIENLKTHWNISESGISGADYDALETILDAMIKDIKDISEKDLQLYGNSAFDDGITYKVPITSEKVYKYYQYESDENYVYSLYYAWFNIYNTDDIENQIETKENELQDLINNNHKELVPISNPNQNRSYYEIFPSANDNSPELILYMHPRNTDKTIAFVEIVDTLPEVGNFNLIYKEGENYYYWDGQVYQQLQPIQVYTTDDIQSYYCYDWRTKLFLDGLRGVINGTDKGYYYEELAAFWPQVYDLENQCFYGEEKDQDEYFKTLTAMGTYYLDFLDSLSTSFGEWSVDNIGRRSDIVVNDEINCLFQPEIPNVILLPANENNINEDLYMNRKSLEETPSIKYLRQEAADNYYPWTQVEDEIYNNIITGGYRNGAFDQIKYELYLHTRYQKTISMTSIPVFYLEPNSRVTIDDPVTNTYGDFVVQSINITFGPGANMSVTCNETLERF